MHIYIYIVGVGMIVTDGDENEMHRAKMHDSICFEAHQHSTRMSGRGMLAESQVFTKCLTVFPRPQWRPRSRGTQPKLSDHSIGTWHARQTRRLHRTVLGPHLTGARAMRGKYRAGCIVTYMVLWFSVGAHRAECIVTCMVLWFSVGAQPYEWSCVVFGISVRSEYDFACGDSWVM